MWTEVLIAVLSGTTLAGMVEAVRFRRETKRLKENEVNRDDVETQRRQIELADLYKEKMLAMLELVSEKQDKGNDNQDKMMERLERMDTRLETMESKVGDIVCYLNGDFKAWQSTNGKEGGRDV